MYLLSYLHESCLLAEIEYPDLVQLAVTWKLLRSFVEVCCLKCTKCKMLLYIWKRFGNDLETI